ncbi:MAG: arylsulfatase [Bacteroidales bacterium]|nr:arylsulfatase [Bacteroidales bacterium]
MKTQVSLFSLTITGLAALPTQGFSQKQPNVIIILADDIGYGDLGWLGAKTIATPNVNRLANEGIRFTNCHATSATSTPSRYGLLTGLYPWRRDDTGIAPGDAAMIIKPEQYTIADMFKNSGYATGAVGKWHLGLGDLAGTQDWNGLVSPGLKDIGFDYSFIMAATGDRVPCVFIENGRTVKLDKQDPIKVSYSTPFPNEPTGKNNPELLRIHPSDGHDMAIVDGIPRIGYMRGGKSALWHDEDIADRITDKALDFIQQNQAKPFFLYFGTNDIHVPRVPNERFVGKSGMGPRGDAILSFDYCVGRVMHALDSLGIADNTLIILSSDNGPVLDDGYKDQAVELLGTHKPGGAYRGGKYSIFEAGTRVPCIVWWKKEIKKPSVSNALVSQIDYFASLSALIKSNIPVNAATDSKNELNALLGKSQDARDYLIEQNINNTLSVVSGNWKYIEPSNGPKINVSTNTELGNNTLPQLYNLKTDNGETKNIAKKFPQKVEHLKALLEKMKEKK